MFLHPHPRSPRLPKNATWRPTSLRRHPPRPQSSRTGARTPRRVATTPRRTGTSTHRLRQKRHEIHPRQLTHPSGRRRRFDPKLSQSLLPCQCRRLANSRVSRYLKPRPVAAAKQVTNQELHRISRLCDVGDAAHLVLQFRRVPRHDALSGRAGRSRLHPLAGADRPASPGPRRGHPAQPTHIVKFELGTSQRLNSHNFMED